MANETPHFHKLLAEEMRKLTGEVESGAFGQGVELRFEEVYGTFFDRVAHIDLLIRCAKEAQQNPALQEMANPERRNDTERTHAGHAA